MNAPNRCLQLLFGEKFFVVRATGNEGLHEAITVRRQGLCAKVVPRLAQGVQQMHERRRTVEPHGIADARRLRRIAAKQDRHALGSVGCMPQACQAHGHAGHELDAVGHWQIFGDYATDGAVLNHHLFEGDGHADDASIELRDRHAHGRVERREAGVTLGPLRMVAGAGDGLNDRQVHGFEKFDGPALSHRHALDRQGAHAIAERADQTIDARLSLLIQEQVPKGCRGPSVPRRL